MEGQHSHSHSFTPPTSDAVSGGSTGARYKLMSPAKLPISRTTSITIPPGLSPTSFLESPVLLSNIKAEPSPTTGSFFNSQLMHGFGGSVALSLSGNCSNSNSFDEQKSNCFEFKPHAGSNSVSGLSTSGHPLSSGFYQQKNELHEQTQNQCQFQSYVSMPLARYEMPTSKESSQYASVNMSTAKASAPSTVEYDELNQRGHSKIGNEDPQSDHRDALPSVAPDKSSDDGYNWRKYGQKLVKGCEFPRSYYKCTYPNCDVKKIFERALDGQIKEIVYKGTHDHPKPQPSRRFTAGALISIQEEKSVNASSLTGQGDTTYSQTLSADQNGTPLSSPRGVNADNVDGASPLLNSVTDDNDNDDQFMKRRRTDVGSIDISPVVKPIREPRVVVQTLSEVDILDDGYRWRKYGQKVVRGNPNPRSYYKCTNAGCPVRKHVERASHDPKAVITTYEGKHNHDVPAAKTNSHDVSGSTPVSGTSRVRLEDCSTISLDLGVGMNYGVENNAYEQQNTLGSEHVRSQVQASTAPTCYGVANGGIILYGSRDNHVENHNFESPPLGQFS
ncbi:WRKY transcription factor [Heracleum sosnowskyi]|uniref:WRKY transcription factor n=1 Tax=Heracleum sosnowskyi TaxID=360622 RepID=A0AAD8NE70_9APIA|nr:WRKY transcription factor [Heracleum sosnowskyi]